jgi:DNA-binding MarR family transcriptional regulator
VGSEAEGRGGKRALIDALNHAFRQDQNRTQAFDELAAKRLGINLTDLRCMDIIEQHGGMTAGDLAEAAHLTTGAVTAVLDRLERAGYACRVRDEVDRRRVRVELTAKAHEAAADIYLPLGADFERFFDRYTSDELRFLLEMLERAGEVQSRHLDRLKAERGESSL